MPYTKPESRLRFVGLMDDAVKIIGDKGKSSYIQGEYLGYFVNRLVKRYLRVTDLETDCAMSFNSRGFAETTRKTLATWADKICALLDGLDPLKAAGDINYVVSGILWGLIGDAEGIEPASYGVRSYFRGIIDKIRDNIVPVRAPGQSDTVMNFRRHIVVKAVLADVITEYNARKMRSYEDEKLEENGDLWVRGKLFVKGHGE